MAKLILVMLGSIAVSVIGARQANAECDAPKSDVHVMVPTTGAAAGMAGVWRGAWPLTLRIGRESRNSSLCARIYISAKDDHNVTVMFCRGSIPELGYAATCTKLDASLKGSELEFYDGSSSYIFKASRPGVLSGQRSSRINPEASTDFQKE